MPTIAIQSPTDQPGGHFRLLDEIKQNLSSPDFISFSFITAFAKVGPMLRLLPFINTWRQKGNKVEAIFGIDEKGTSLQALEFAITSFDNTYIAKVGAGAFRPTFHPKIYFFLGPNRALIYIGSNNMTLGGMETNAESLIKLELTLPADNADLSQALRCWTDTLTICLPLNRTLLGQLVADQFVIDELQMRKNRATNRGANTGRATSTINFPAFNVIPPSSLPRTISTPIRPRPARTTAAAVPANAPNLNVSNTQALAIQITPHHNGEILLSKVAVNQNPTFFGWPFTGSTSPKKVSNPSYPQRIPDPVVNIIVYDIPGNVILSHTNYNLNTVFYEIKAEIRITVPQNVIQNTPDLSMMVMRESSVVGVDYDIYIYPPTNQDFINYLAVCNQTMPSGGKSTARKFDWI